MYVQNSTKSYNIGFLVVDMCTPNLICPGLVGLGRIWLLNRLELVHTPFCKSYLVPKHFTDNRKKRESGHKKMRSHYSAP